MPARAAVGRIVFVVRIGIPWEYLPKQFGCSGMAFWHRSTEACWSGCRRRGRSTGAGRNTG